MSFFRAKNRALNKNVFFDQRVYGFLKSPIRTGNLYVENNENVNKDLTVGGNMAIANNLLVKGDQTIGGDLDVSGNQTIGGDLEVKGDQTIGGDLDVKGDVSANSVYATGNFYLDNYLLIPYGTIIQSAAVSVPIGWLACDGASVSKITYPELFGAISNTYGGSGLNFNVPDLRGRVAVGSGAGAGLTSRALASSGGDETHTLSVGEMPSHTHTSNATGDTIGLMIANGIDTAEGADSSLNEPNVMTRPTALIINETGGGQAHNNMQPFLVLNYFIKY